MFEKLSRSWSLTKQSWSVLQQDKRLVLFPVVSAISTLVVCALLLVPGIILVVANMSEQPAGASTDATKDDLMATIGPWGMLGLFVIYFIANFITTYFNSALLACVMNRFDGLPSAPSDGLKLANSRLGKIAAWSLLNASVGMLINILQDKVDFLARWLIGLVGVAWQIVTFFVVPVMVVENTGPIDSVKRSFEVLKKTWGESLVSQYGVGAAMTLLSLLVLVGVVAPGIALSIFASSAVPVAIAAVLAVAALIAITVVGSTLKAILVAACYRYAVTGEAPGTFDQTVLAGAFAPTTKK